MSQPLKHQGKQVCQRPVLLDVVVEKENKVEDFFGDTLKTKDGVKTVFFCFISLVLFEMIDNNVINKIYFR